MSQNPFEMDTEDMENCPVVTQVEICLSFRKSCSLPSPELQRRQIILVALVVSSKAASMMLGECSSALAMVCLLIWKVGITVTLNDGFEKRKMSPRHNILREGLKYYQITRANSIIY